MTRLLGNLGFKRIDIYGCTPGNFTRDKMLTPDDFEMLIIAAC